MDATRSPRTIFENPRKLGVLKMAWFLIFRGFCTSCLFWRSRINVKNAQNACKIGLSSSHCCSQPARFIESRYSIGCCHWSHKKAPENFSLDCKTDAIAAFAPLRAICNLKDLGTLKMILRTFDKGLHWTDQLQDLRDHDKYFLVLRRIWPGATANHVHLIT